MLSSEDIVIILFQKDSDEYRTEHMYGNQASITEIVEYMTQKFGIVKILKVIR